jgi:hypothetical protein
MLSPSYPCTNHIGAPYEPQIDLPFGEQYVKSLDSDWSALLKSQAVKYVLLTRQMSRAHHLLTSARICEKTLMHSRNTLNCFLSLGYAFMSQLKYSKVSMIEFECF